MTRDLKRLLAVLAALVVVAAACTDDATDASGDAASDGFAVAQPGPTAEDHWHAAFGLYLCDAYVPSNQVVDRDGAAHDMHTHGDGLIHIHPFSDDTAGSNANMGLFADTIGVDLDGDPVDCGGPASWRLLSWEVVERDDDGVPTLWNDDITPIVDPAAIAAYVPEDGELVTLAYMAVDDETIPPQPPGRDKIGDPGDVA